MSVLKQVISYSQQKLSQDKSGHDFLHAKRVAHLSEKMIEKDQLIVDREIVLCSAYLHDVIDDKVVANPQDAVKELTVFLTEVGLSEDKQRAIFDIIENLSFSAEIAHGKQSLSLEGQIVQDADRIEALGAIGILRTAYFGGGHGHPIHDESIKPQVYTTKESYRKGSTVINHFYEKLFLLPDKMNTKAGKQEAMRRKQFMETFLQEFYDEWQI